MKTTATAAPAWANVRRQLEVAIERAIALLDTLDGDADLETGCDDDLGHDGREPDEGDATYVYLLQHYPDATA